MQSQPFEAADLVWVTRAQPGADATAQRLRERGWTPLIAPLIATRLLPLEAGALEGVDALAFTSAAGVRAFTGGGTSTSLPVFTVGDATADAAHAAGFTRVLSAQGAGADLARLIAAVAPFARLAHLGAREPAFDLVAALRAAGRPAIHLPLYETVAQALPPAAEAALAQGRIAAVLIHSPAAARALRGVANGASLASVTVVALSAACAEPVAGPAATVAATPTEAALLDALERAFPSALGKRDERS